MSSLERLEQWYLAQCNGEWEHGYGLRIDTIDNPGWSVHINIACTPLSGRKFTKVETDIDDDHVWMVCEVKKGEFVGHGGALMLHRIIEVFLDWAVCKSEPSSCNDTNPPSAKIMPGS